LKVEYEFSELESSCILIEYFMWRFWGKTV